MTGLLHLIRTSVLLRSAIVALLLGCMGVGVFGDLLVFSIVRADIRRNIQKKIKAEIPGASLTLIKISNANQPKDFTFTEAGREFRYRGQMYDIVHTEVKDDTTYYKCIHDEKETVLYANLNHQIHDEYAANPIHHEKQNKLLKKIPKVYLLPTNLFFLGFTCYTQKPDEPHPNWLDVLPTIYVPPPEIA